MQIRRAVWKALSRSVRVASLLRLGTRFPVFRRMYWSIHPVLKPKHAYVAGRWMEIHRHDIAISDALLKHGVYEPFETELLRRVLRRGSVFLDVGANIGYHTLVGADAVSQEGVVVAVEPSESNLQLLRRNVDGAGFTNVTIIDCAVGSISGSVMLYESTCNTGDHRSYPVEGRQGHEVPVRPLDEVLEAIGVVPAVIKIDIQGFEQWALEGATRSISQTRECALLTEFWASGLVGAAASPIGYYDLLRSLGFELFEIDEENRRLQPFDRDGAARVDIDTNLLGLKGVDLSAYGLSPG